MTKRISTAHALLAQEVRHKLFACGKSIPFINRTVSFALVFIGVLICSLLLMLHLPSSEAFAGSGRSGDVGHVSYVGKTLTDEANKNPSGTPAHSRRMEITIDGITLLAICAEHEKDPPSKGDAVYNRGVVTNSDIRRVLYYGFEGPEDKGYSLVRTATAVSAANGHMETSLAQDMIDAVRKLPAPPDTWIVEKWSTGTSGTQQLVTGRLIPKTGWVSLQKASALPELTNNNPNYSLKGAEYGIFASEAEAKKGANKIGSLTTNDKGFAKSQELNEGTYYIKELKAPQGMKLDTTVYPVSVVEDKTTAVNSGKVSDQPLYGSIELLLTKADAESTNAESTQAKEHTSAQGTASLAGSEWKVCFYAGFYETAEKAKAAGKPLRTWILKSNNEGKVLLRDSAFVSGDEFYRDAKGNPVLPLGTVTLEETKAPQGYLNTAQKWAEAQNETYPYARIINGTSNEVIATNYLPLLVADDVIRGGVRIQKVDLETHKSTPLGKASFEGTSFAIVSNNNQPVYVNGAWYNKGETVCEISVKDGYAETTSTTLPYGGYKIKELTVGQGYLLSEEVLDFNITEHGKMMEFTNENAFANQVVRGDLEFVKANGENAERLACIPFKLTSETTGESHVLMTDENGYASTASSFNPHSTNTNANDEDAQDPLVRIWFSGTAEQETEPQDSLGALPYDSYTLEELSCDANEGLQLVTLHGIVVSRDNYVIQLGTIDDPKAYISSYASGATKDSKELYASKQAQITDTIFYTGLVPNRTYELRGQLIEKETEKALTLSGKQANKTQVVTQFTPENSFGTVQTTYEFDARAHGGKQIMVAEELYSNGHKVANDVSLTNENQTVRILPPEIKSEAYDGLDGDKCLAADTEAVLSDTVTYHNLTPNESYTLIGKLVDAETGNELLLGGKPITSQKSFMSEQSSGSIEVTFEFDGTSFADKKVVVYEYLYSDDICLARHADQHSESQTVEIRSPKLSTFAIDAVDEDKQVVTDPSSRLIDRVSYTNVAPGKEYLLQTTVLGAKTEQVLQHEGKEICIETKFTPETSEGTLEVPITCDTTLLADKEIVMYQTLLRKGTVVAKHCDSQDENQTLSVIAPQITTQAQDTHDGNGVVTAEKKASITDLITYENLVPNRKYVVRGALLNQETEEVLLADGVPLIVEKEFTPTEANGTVSMEFTFDARSLVGNLVVAFEVIEAEGTVVAQHTDIADENQTIGVSKPPTGETYDKTGRSFYIPLVCIVLLAVCVGIGKRVFRKNTHD